jgi:hypothetical protein
MAQNMISLINKCNNQKITWIKGLKSTPISKIFDPKTPEKQTASMSLSRMLF